jgi:chromosome segregation ATPase
MTSDLAHVEQAVEQFRAELADLQRRMDPLVDQYEGMKRIDTDEDERLHKALAMVWSAWWDITETIAYLRAADRRLRNEGGSLATDVAQES